MQHSQFTWLNSDSRWWMVLYVLCICNIETEKKAPNGPTLKKIFKKNQKETKTGRNSRSKRKKNKDRTKKQEPTVKKERKKKERKKDR